jgi:uncharacterized protein
MTFWVLSLVMIDHSERDGRLTFKVRVVPRSSRSEIIGEHDGTLRVRIAAPPVDGAANEELVLILAKAFNISRRAVEITAGHSSKLKCVSLTGASATALAAFTKPGE